MGLLKEKYFVYALINNNEIVYIGMSGNVDVRIYSHKKDKVFTDYKILYTSDYLKASNKELKLIKKHQPKYNGNGTIAYRLRQQQNRMDRSRKAAGLLFDKRPFNEYAII